MCPHLLLQHPQILAFFHGVWIIDDIEELRTGEGSIYVEGFWESVNGEKFMAEIGKLLFLSGLLVVACAAVVTAQEGLGLGLEEDISRRDHGVGENLESGYFTRSFLQQSRNTVFRHVWPDMEFGWRIVVGTVIGFFGAALGSVGGVGGGGIFVPMLTLIIGFDPKTSTAVSK
ncbi:Sulfite exporter TauE/SafE family protein 3, partial [Sesamum alatum]